ncbi:hypothetical protein [Deinococcus ruber]|uniref:Uncharacterized protein n=1 Tax=Deinococcus ruber TaxID=1848197 RepID=A0A918C129_9DEIO|nr:hypothetical protein [Deinococcus ruber]GGR00289.1 hypothetical protein GCM10008957_11310 [Deinococcus ruber]
MTKRLQTDTPPSPPDQSSSDTGQVDLIKPEDTQPEEVKDTQLEQAAPTEQEARFPFEQHAAHAGMTSWRLAALPVHANWVAGQEVTAEQFATALKALDEEVIV